MQTVALRLTYLNAHRDTTKHPLPFTYADLVPPRGEKQAETQDPAFGVQTVEEKIAIAKAWNYQIQQHLIARGNGRSRG